MEVGSLHFCVKPKPQVFFMRLLRNFPGGCRVVFFPACGSEYKKLYGAEKIFFANFKLAAR